MEVIGSLQSENNPGTIQKGERNPKMAPLTGSAMRRKRFSDITNTASSGRSQRPEINEQANPNGDPTSSLKDYIAVLVKENNALLRLLDERNKIIEITGTELQKLKTSLQKSNQQNWQLAQSNSHMLAELNLGKDRLKAMQHELGCRTALLRAKTLEVEELKKLNKKSKQLGERIVIEESRIKPNELVVESSHQANVKKTCNANRKRTLRSRSLGPSTVTRQESAKEKDEGRRKSLRRRSDNAKTGQCESSEDLFEIEDINLPISSHEGSCLHNPESIENQNQGSQRRLSLGRPMRRAAEKVSSYKEAPINAKMRRAE